MRVLLGVGVLLSIAVCIGIGYWGYTYVGASTGQSDLSYQTFVVGGISALAASMTMAITLLYLWATLGILTESISYNRNESIDRVLPNAIINLEEITIKVGSRTNDTLTITRLEPIAQRSDTLAVNDDITNIPLSDVVVNVVANLKVYLGGSGLAKIRVSMPECETTKEFSQIASAQDDFSQNLEFTADVEPVLFSREKRWYGGYRQIKPTEKIHMVVECIGRRIHEKVSYELRFDSWEKLDDAVSEPECYNASLHEVSRVRSNK